MSDLELRAALDRVYGQLAINNSKLAELGRGQLRIEAKLESQGRELGDVKSVVSGERISFADHLDPPTNGLTGKSILVVEDESFLLGVTVKHLRGRGATCAPAECVVEALSHARALQFDVALIDIYLPDGRGDELARALRATQPHLAIVFTSGLFPDDLDDLPAVKLEKSYSREELVDAVYKALGIERHDGPTFSGPLDGPPTVPAGRQTVTPPPSTADESPQAKRGNDPRCDP